MIGSISKWWSVTALALLSIAPCAFASSMLTVTATGEKMGFCIAPYYASVHGRMNTPVICDDFANETYSIGSRNYTSNTFSSLGSVFRGNHRQNAPLNGLNSLGAENWLGMMPSNLTSSRFTNFVILTPKACPIGQGSCRMSVPEGGSEAAYLLMAALSCFAAMLFRRRGQTSAA